MLILFLLTIIFIIFGVSELVVHKKNLARIKVRILVNGTRGKSSVTRLIAGALWGGKRKVVAKTTGTRPRFIISPKEEFEIKRLGKANIIEEKKIFRAALKYNPEIMVSECMALNPECQSVLREKLIVPTICVITNVRKDHLDVMGPTLKDVAINLAKTIPKNGVLFLLKNNEFSPLFSQIAHRRKTKVISVDTSEITEESLKGFNYVEHKENVALALAVAKYLGVDEQTSLEGMYTTNPDPGVLRIYQIEFNGKKIELINTMAANDPDSILILWNKFKDRFKRKIVLMNCRADRIDRSIQLGELVAKSFIADYYFATGLLTKPFITTVMKSGLNKERIIDLEKKEPKEVLNKVAELISDKALLFATGNIVGYGEQFIEYCKKFSQEIT